MPKKLFYQVREIEGQLDYWVFLDENNAPSDEVIKQLEIVKRDIDNLICNYKNNRWNCRFNE